MSYCKENFQYYNELLDFLNKEKIAKENIVSILHDDRWRDTGIILIYIK